MDKSEARRIVERSLEPLMRDLGVRHWTIEVDYDLREGDGGPDRTRGRCDVLIDYDKAWISLDPDCFDDEADLLEVLRHELFHVVLAPLELFGGVIEETTRGDAKLERIAAHVWRYVHERAVANLERMYRGLTEGGIMRQPKSVEGGAGPAKGKPKPKAATRPKPKPVAKPGPKAGK